METARLRETLRDHSSWLVEGRGVRANLRGATLRGIDLRVAHLSGADLSEADLNGANLIEANLSEANLRGADLRGANLIAAHLSGANLSEANLSGANLNEANLSGANLRGATIREGLTAFRLKGVASRGDQYSFFGVELAEGAGMFFYAGCRAFTRAEFDAHIKAAYPGTPKAKATKACLDYLTALEGF
jgi:hypothetical protein